MGDQNLELSELEDNEDDPMAQQVPMDNTAPDVPDIPRGAQDLEAVYDGCESRMAVMSAAWFVEFRQRLPWLLHVD